MAKGVSLREHVLALLQQMELRYQQRFDAQTSAINAALQATKEAVIKAETATERRFESVNEFRQTLSDQAGTFISRTEFNSLKERMDRGEGRSGGLKDGWGWVVGAVGLVGGLAITYFKH
jgi:hypothetical protein